MMIQDAWDDILVLKPREDTPEIILKIYERWGSGVTNEFELTLDAARELAAALLRMVDELDGEK